MVEELAQADDAVAACVDAAAWALPEHDLIAALDAAHRLEQRLAAVKLALIREIDGRGTARTQGASSHRGLAARTTAAHRPRRPPARRPRRRPGHRQPRHPTSAG